MDIYTYLLSKRVRSSFLPGKRETERLHQSSVACVRSVVTTEQAGGGSGLCCMFLLPFPGAQLFGSSTLIL